MKKSLLPLLACLPLLALSPSLWQSTTYAAGTFTAVDTEPTHQPALGIGGCGGIYLLAEPGELTIDIYKRDRNHRGRTMELRAILFGPDRQVLDEIAIADDGQTQGSGLGPLTWAKLSTIVRHKGIYGVNITVSQDRYGEEIVWGFRTTCPKYLSETSRGHRAQRREEPIVLQNPGQPGNVCFLPRRAAFRVDVSGLPGNTQKLVVFNDQGQLLQELPVNNKGQAACSFGKDESRGDKPWRLQLPSQQATIHIDGVTRWSTGDLNENLPYWSPDPNAFFPFLQFRWLLTPYRRLVLGQPGEQRELVFEVHNNSPRSATIRLAVESDGHPPVVQLSAERIQVPPRHSVPVTLACIVPAAGKEQRCRVRATPEETPDFTTYSTLTLRAGRAPAEDPINLPLVLRPYEHENQQFGYLPSYPVESQMYFDLDNRSLTRWSDGIATNAAGRWQRIRLTSAIIDPQWHDRSLNIISTKLAFDTDNDLYALGKTEGETVLLHSTDRGQSFAVYVIPGRDGGPCTFDMEQFSGHNVPLGPPPIVRYTRTAADPHLIWRRINDLELILPSKRDGRLAFGPPILISRKCIGLSSHSGIPSSVVSRGNKVHVAWGEATDPGQKVPGVPTYVVTVDRLSGRMGEPSLVAYGPPANDVHNSPSITMDSHGYLHVLAGTHGQPFPYCRSLKPNDAATGWTKPELVGDGRQTYIGLVCGADDTLHMVFRMWRNKTQPHPLSIHATLAYQRKRPGKPWEDPRVLVVAPFSEYSIFYHRLTIDRLGRLFLSYDYWSTYWFYRTDHRGDRRALLMSADTGDTWKLVGADDLIAH